MLSAKVGEHGRHTPFLTDQLMQIETLLVICRCRVHIAAVFRNNAKIAKHIGCVCILTQRLEKFQRLMVKRSPRAGSRLALPPAAPDYSVPQLCRVGCLTHDAGLALLEVRCRRQSIVKIGDGAQTVEHSGNALPVVQLLMNSLDALKIAFCCGVLA